MFLVPLIISEVQSIQSGGGLLFPHEERSAGPGQPGPLPHRSFPFSSVVDPDPQGSELIFVCWIRILMGMRIRIQKGNNDQQNGKKGRKCMF
jgi:hypothetical protein